MLKGFRTFVLRGNVIDLAVAVVMGAAFGAVVTAFVKDLLTPIIGIFDSKPDFSALAFTVNGSKFLIGNFINELISFLLISVAVYFFVVLPMTKVLAHLKHNEMAAPTTKACPECLSEIPLLARKCKFCASTVAA